MGVPWYVTRWRYRRRRLWMTPAMIVLLAGFLSWLLPAVDRDEDTNLSRFFKTFDVGALASLLSSVASGMIAFTGFVFTAVTLALQFGTSAFSARLIPVFQRDRVIRCALGVFLATFVYAMLITIRLGARLEDYKPAISVLFVLVLMMTSVAMFIALVQRIIDMLRVVRLLRRVAFIGRRAIARNHPDRHDASVVATTERPDLGAPDRVIRYTGRPGPVVAVNRNQVVRLAERWDLTVVLVPAVGDFVTRGNPIMEVYGKTTPHAVRALRRCLVARDERSLDYDPAFALRVLSDVANKALSPAINDPTTAVQALDYVEDLLIRLGYSHLDTAGAIRDRAGVVRLWFRPPSWEDFVALGLDEIRHYGATSLQVVRRLRALLDDVATATPPARHPALRLRREALDADVERSFPNPLDRRLAQIPDAQGLGSAGRSLYE